MSENKTPQAGKERIGVYVCHCGTNISATVDVEDVAVWSRKRWVRKVLWSRVTINSCAPV